jgi:hypothetical protein
MVEDRKGKENKSHNYNIIQQNSKSMDSLVSVSLHQLVTPQVKLKLSLGLSN